MKKTLSLILSLVLIISTISVLNFSAFADDVLKNSGSIGDNITYTFDSANGLMTVSGTGAIKDYSCAPFSNSRVKKLVIEEGITSIGNYVFSQFSALEEIVFPDTLETIGFYSISYCTSLTEISFPDSVQTIEASAFGYSSNITKVTIGKGVRSIDGSSFTTTNLKEFIVDSENVNYASVDGNLYNASKTEFIKYAMGKTASEFTIPGYVTSIASYAFSNDSTNPLKKVIVPGSVKKLSSCCFRAFSSAEEIVLSEGVEAINSRAFEYCPVKVLTLPDSMKNISSYAFADSYLETLNISKNVTSLSGCLIRANKLTTVTVDAENPLYKCVDNVIYSIDGKTLYGYAPGKTDTTFVIPDGVETIGYGALSYSNNLTSVTIPDTVKTIGIYAFQGSNKITEFNIPKSVTCIEAGAFQYTLCSKITVNNPYCSINTGLSTFNGNNNSNLEFISYTKCDGTDSTLKAYVDTYASTFTKGYTNLGASNHIYDSIPVSNDDGTHEYKCLNCDAAKSEDCTLSAVEAKAATCTVDGNTEGEKCSLCGYFKSGEVIPATGHKLVTTETVISPASCTTTGLKQVVSTCSECTYTETSYKQISVLAHNMVKIEEVPATCTENGLTGYEKCSVCGYVYNQPTLILAPGHTVVTDVAVKETCTTAGKTEGSHCSVCKAVITEQTVIPATGHTSDKGTVTKTATCTQNGTMTYTCTVCKAVIETSTIKATGHIPVIDEAVKATCTTAGKTEGSHCSVCNAVITAQTVIPATGHTSDKGTVTKAATCTKTGTKTYKCTVCKAVIKTSTIKATGHKAVTLPAVTATVKKSGLTEGSKCSVCGKILVAQKMTLARATGLKASTVKTTSIALKWTAVNGAKYYKVEQYNASTKKWTAIKTTTATSCIVSKLTAGTSYKFRVTALDSTKKIAGKASAILTVSTLCKAPTFKLTSTKSKTATVTVTKVTGAKFYTIYKSTDNKKWTKVTTTTKTSYNLTKLTAGKKIYVKVVANNADSKASAYSSVKYVTVKK